MIIGCTLGHDASACFVSNSGEVLFAAGEERFSRSKGHMGAPYQSIRAGMQYLNLTEKDVSKIEIVIAGTSKLDSNLDWFYLLLLDNRFQAKYDIFNEQLPPGLLLSLKKEMSLLSGNLFQKVHFLFQKNLGINVGILNFINHHDAHAASAFWNSNFEESLVLTLDGSGDGECGSLRIANRNGTEKILGRFSEKFSIGHLYSEVTKRYGFKESKHEGKITGLGAYSDLASNDLNFDQIFGRKFLCNFSPKYRIDPRFRNFRDFRNMDARQAMKLAVSRTERKFDSYPDLAASIQKYTEELICNYVVKQTRKYRMDNIALAGGVFSNVLINGKIAELPNSQHTFVYPNMGDGGLCIGAALEYLRLSGTPQVSKFDTNMYLGNIPELKNLEIKSAPRTPQDLANEIINGKIVGIIFDRMEFGPRALCHRSIVASPTNKEINISLNRRLNRTEFMPFAPVVRDIDFDKVFCSSKGENLVNLRNFNFMTQTCHVRNEVRSKIPAVVHLDGTARPQILKVEDNPFLYESMGILSNHHDTPVIINTSFNAHEEPIISDLDQSIACLKRNQIDALYFGSLELKIEN